MSRWFVAAGLVLCFVAAGCDRRPPESPFAGTWRMTLGEHTFIVLTLRDAPGGVTGEMRRPRDFSTSDFHRFSVAGAEVKTERVTRSEVRDGRLHFTTAAAGDATDTNDYDMSLDGQGARIRLSDVPEAFDAMVFTRADDPGVAVYTGWERGCAYSTGEVKASNPEMQTIYDEDQKPRQDPSTLTPAAWQVISKDDAVRQERTRALLTAGALHTAEDFTRASFIFQHGNSPDDYLMAHTLATIAVAKGDASASWIATATLDRYLQSIGQPQVYGTQFKPVPGGGATQEPFRRDLISDALRRELGVPVLAAQLEQQKEFAKDFEAAAAK